jgi:hypothetical protein
MLTGGIAPRDPASIFKNLILLTTASDQNCSHCLETSTKRKREKNEEHYKSSGQAKVERLPAFIPARCAVSFTVFIHDHHADEHAVVYAGNGRQRFSRQ